MQAATKWMAGVALATVVLVTSVVPADARIRYRERHAPHSEFDQGGFQLYAGFGGQGYEIKDNDYAYLDELNSDGSFFVGAALGLEDNLSVFVEAAGSDHQTDVGDMTFGYAHVGLKYAPSSAIGQRWQPYGKVSFGAIGLVEDRYWDECDCHDDNGYVGPSLGLGFGVDHFLSRRVAIFGEAGFLFGEFSHQVIDGEDYELRDDIGLTSGRLQFGLRLRL